MSAARHRAPWEVLKANNEEDGAASVEDLAKDESRNMGAGRGPRESTRKQFRGTMLVVMCLKTPFTDKLLF